MKKLMGIFLICFVAQMLAAQSSSTLLFRNLTINEGLSQNSVISITEDKTGFLWFATQDGLNRYDGNDFFVVPKTFDDNTSATERRLGKVLSVADQKLWLITTKGKLESLNLFTHHIEEIIELPGTAQTVPPLNTMLLDSKNNIWLGTENEGIIVYNPVTQTARKLDIKRDTNCMGCLSINNMYEDKQQNIWCATKDGLLVYSLEGQLLKTYLRSGNENKSPISFSSVAEDDNGSIWVGSFGKGLFVKRKENSDFSSFKGLKNFDLLSQTLVVEALLADENRLWIGTYGKGLLLHSIVDSVTQQFLNNRSNIYSIGFNDVLEIYKDKQGGIWLGTDGGGVSYYSQQMNNFNLISNANVPENISIAPIRSITEDSDGIVWIGTSSGGFTRVDARLRKFQTYYLESFNKEAGNSNRIVSLNSDKNDLWVGTQGNGLLLFDTRKGVRKKWFHTQATPPLNITDNTVWCMMQAGENKIWAGTQKGVLLLVDKDEGVIESSQPEAHKNAGSGAPIRAIAKMNDSILLLGRENGLINLFNSNNHSFSSKIIDVAAGLNTSLILKSILFRYPYLWIGTQGKGLISYNINTGGFALFSEKEGLPNSTVYAIVDDEFNNLWLSTNKGICSFNLSVLNKNFSGSMFRIFKMSDGLQGNEFNTGAFFKSRSGTLYFGGINGLNFFKPQHFYEAGKTAKVAITNIIVDNVSVEKDTTLTYKKQMVLPYHYRSLTFRFSVLDFLSAGRYTYYYQMLGYDKDWIKANEQNFATYTNLPPGEYTFNIKAAIPGADSQSEITSLMITVNPPFWKTWWFLIIAVALLGAGLYGLYRYRIGQLMKVQMIRNRIATDLHDEIGSALSNINMLTAITKKKLEEPSEADKYLSRISEEVTGSGQALDDIIWSVDTKNDTLEEMIARMRRYAAELFEATDNIKCDLDFEEGIASRKINIEERRDIYLVYKEALNNIYKHSGAKYFKVKVFLRDNVFCLQIKDDGVGFDATQLTHRNGLKNMKARVERWKGKIDIQSGPEGSSIVAEVPV